MVFRRAIRLASKAPGSTPRKCTSDDRGSFAEAFRGAEFAADLGYRLDVAQVNCSVSRRGVIRGIHYADVPPGQAKYVTCVAGAILDVVVDLRERLAVLREVGSGPTRRRARAARFSSPRVSGTLSWPSPTEPPRSTSARRPTLPGASTAWHPLDPAIGIAWPTDDGPRPVLSDKDAAAPTLEQALRAGQLPRYADCAAYRWTSSAPDAPSNSKRPGPRGGPGRFIDACLLWPWFRYGQQGDRDAVLLVQASALW
jgi:dTDP-4-dehydrorhamnose 3,5-epimerase